MTAPYPMSLLPRHAPPGEASVARCCDELGSYPVVLCPLCGEAVPVAPTHRSGDLAPIPSHIWADPWPVFPSTRSTSDEGATA